GVERVERTGHDNRLYSATIQLLETVQQRQSRREALIGLHKRVADQQNKIDLLIDGQRDKAVEGGPCRVLNDGSEPGWQSRNFTDRLIEARIGSMQKAQGRESHSGNLPFPAKQA